jgi:curved DNA-binding protein CbpA
VAPGEVLGVSPTAGPDEVTAAFRSFALRHHPDRGGDPVRFEAGVDAYRALLAADRRRTHRAGPEVVFHRRRRRRVTSLLRVARRRLAADRSRP